MGSSCSSRQSTKDESNSEHSEDSQTEKGNEESDTSQRNERDASVERVEAKDHVGGAVKQTESIRSDGHTAGTPVSTTAGSQVDFARNKSIEERQPSLCLDLPDLTTLPETTRQILEGRIGSHEGKLKSSCLSVCLLGDSIDSGAERLAVKTHLTDVLNATGRDHCVLNVDANSLSEYPFETGSLVANYISEGSARSHFFTIIFLRDTIGQWVPPSAIVVSDYHSILEALAKSEDKELFHKHYKEDELSNPPGMKLNSKLNQSKKESLEDFEKLCSALMSISDNKIKDKYLQTPLEQIIQKIVETDRKASILIWVKSAHGNNLKKDPSMRRLSSEEEQKRLDRILKLLTDGVPQDKIISVEAKSETESYMKDLSSQVEKLVKDSGKQKAIEDFRNLMKDGVRLELLKELSVHNDFCRSLPKGALRVSDSILSDAKKYVTGPSSNVFVIGGESGSGKTHLAAHIALHSHEWIENACVIQRFANVSGKSKGLESLIYFIFEHCLFLYGTPKTSWEPSKLTESLVAVWEKTTPSRPLIIIIDGLDQLKYVEKTDFNWLPNALPNNVKVILTVQRGSHVWEYFTQRDQTEIVEIKPPSIEEAEMMLKNMVKDTHKRFPASAWKNIKASTLNPLQLLVFSRFLMLLESEEGVQCSSVDEAIETLITQLMLRFKKKVVELLLGCLALTRVGLTDREMISLLESTSSQTDDNNSLRDWLLLRIILHPLLHVREENDVIVTSFQSTFLIQKVQKHLFKSDAVKSTCYSAIQKHVLRNDVNKLLENTNIENFKPSVASVRTLQENLINLLSKSDEIKLLFNIKYLYLKTLACRPFQILEEVKAAISRSPEHKELHILKEFFKDSLLSLAQDSSQFYLQLYGRLKWRATAAEYPLISSLVEAASKPPQLWFVPLSPCFPQNEKQSSDGKTTYNYLFKIPNNPHHVVTVSTEQGQLAVWNIFQMTPVRTLTDINQPRKLEMIDDHKCLLLCGRELRIYDLEQGQFLMKLREVMNQKMPFFGLHNADHVVALSRSRMYVNMMNLTEGNCVTTFKVGEDRFLSSLTVSENGKICVCGDDSQKPSALLVWDLENRKLLYDLRIPHHEFAMKLVAITQEGHYVCSVCRELDEPAPNFIVVYDLQSGTLFKRWKPGVDTVSITISTAGNCVIVSLQNASLMAYDLITGNPRWSSQGHSCPPDTFKLDPDGIYLLSYDSAGKDRSLRAWDVQSGKTLAVLTPDQKIISCEIACDGKAIILSLEGISQLFTFILRDFVDILNNLNTKPYGNVELSGKSFNLGQAQAT